MVKPRFPIRPSMPNLPRPMGQPINQVIFKRIGNFPKIKILEIQMKYLRTMFKKISQPVEKRKNSFTILYTGGH